MNNYEKQFNQYFFYQLLEISYDPPSNLGGPMWGHEPEVEKQCSSLSPFVPLLLRFR